MSYGHHKNLGTPSVEQPLSGAQPMPVNAQPSLGPGESPTRTVKTPHPISGGGTDVERAGVRSVDHPFAVEQRKCAKEDAYRQMPPGEGKVSPTQEPAPTGRTGVL